MGNIERWETENAHVREHGWTGQAVIGFCYAVAGGADEIAAVLATHQGAVARAEKAEAYAKEGWDWLAEALESLGVETVFDIPTWKARRAASSE